MIYPDVLLAIEVLRELTAERPAMLLVSENKSASFSSAAYVPSGVSHTCTRREIEIERVVQDYHKVS